MFQKDKSDVNLRVAFGVELVAGVKHVSSHVLYLVCRALALGTRPDAETLNLFLFHDYDASLCSTQLLLLSLVILGSVIPLLCCIPVVFRYKLLSSSESQEVGQQLWDDKHDISCLG